MHKQTRHTVSYLGTGYAEGNKQLNKIFACLPMKNKRPIFLICDAAGPNDENLTHFDALVYEGDDDNVIKPTLGGSQTSQGVDEWCKSIIDGDLWMYDMVGPCI